MNTLCDIYTELLNVPERGVYITAGLRTVTSTLKKQLIILT